ncbi:hypothetical protein THAOC_18948 [Thalassiosira oceanica]|uniref:Uncharacterized protein n=1 Tax=Thalassiosira oceanica TaxID=159749 RepID=K0S3N6_THAOC|nr:hypothetical protein THAOC_18948 [Thalassiosira oceanica]|eukprot:EJK60658.1 hypothetical protein THAOC_18948 [Thalassiosira oceanica]
MPLVTGWTPRGLVGGMEEDAADLSEEAMSLDIRGGLAYHAMTDQYPLTKALPGLAVIGLHNWGVECTDGTGIPSRCGSLTEVIGEPGMVSPPQPVDELGSRDPYGHVKITKQTYKASWNKPVMP